MTTSKPYSSVDEYRIDCENFSGAHDEDRIEDTIEALQKAHENVAHLMAEGLELLESREALQTDLARLRRKVQKAIDMLGHECPGGIDYIDVSGDPAHALSILREALNP